ncbi:MAG: RNA polymerase sporulation sigma factor SigE [Clostridia bacterium]|nr:RNA polymerase sporulation sigma factor SigE [Clostridia bacterium]
MTVISLFSKLWAKLFRKNKRLFYINGAEALPKPLSPEEEAALIERMEEEDAVRAKLVEHNLRLVVYIAKKFENTGVGIEDLISIGTIGLVKAINTFRPEKNIKLATYASRCIENEILMFLRKGQNLHELSLEEPLTGDNDGNELLLSDILATDDESVFKQLESEEDRKILHAALNTLDEREKIIIFLRFGLIDGKEMTQKEVADLLGISQSYISRLEKKIIVRLREEIGDKI